MKTVETPLFQSASVGPVIVEINGMISQSTQSNHTFHSEMVGNAVKMLSVP